jgi:hypothetical protein
MTGAVPGCATGAGAAGDLGVSEAGGVAQPASQSRAENAASVYSFI